MSIRDISSVISYNGSIWSGKESNGGLGKWIHEVANRPITRLKSSWLERALTDCKVRNMYIIGTAEGSRVDLQCF